MQLSCPVRLYHDMCAETSGKDEWFSDKTRNQYDHISLTCIFRVPRDIFQFVDLSLISPSAHRPSPTERTKIDSCSAQTLTLAPGHKLPRANQGQRLGRMSASFRDIVTCKSHITTMAHAERIVLTGYWCTKASAELDLIQERLLRAQLELALAQDAVDSLERRKSEVLRRMGCKD